MLTQRENLDAAMQNQAPESRTATDARQNFSGNLSNNFNTCPCCGYCKHCGRSNQQPNLPYTYPGYPYPYTEPYKITWSTNSGLTTTDGFGYKSMI